MLYLTDDMRDSSSLSMILSKAAAPPNTAATPAPTANADSSILESDKKKSIFKVFFKFS